LFLDVQVLDRVLGVEGLVLGPGLAFSLMVLVTCMC